MNDKMQIARNAVIRNNFGGYGRLVEDGALGKCIYIKKYSVFTVISFNLYTQTVLAVNSATKETVSLEYNFLLENCEVLKQPSNVILDSISIVNINKSKPQPNLLKLTFATSVIIELTLLVLYIISVY